VPNDDPPSSLPPCSSLEQYTDASNRTWMRQTFNAEVSDFDFADSYAPPFQRAIQVGGAAGVMYAANEFNGVPCAGSAALDAVLHSWNFDGYRCTDGGQIINMVVGHKFTPTLDQAIGFAALAESDIADGSEYETDLVHAVVNGNTTLALAQRLLANIMRVRMRLGNFDPPAGQPYLSYTVADINTDLDRAAIDLASREALVLLKNSNNNVLPLSAAVHKTLAVIGPNANLTKVLQGNYGGQYCPLGPHGPLTDCFPTVFTALQAYAPNSIYVQGAGIDVSVSGGIQDAVAAVAQADAAVLVIGLDQTQEAEQLDRFSMALPQAQQDLYAAVSAAAAAAKIPCVVVLVHGGALAIPEIVSSADAILDAFYPGVTGGPAIADALFGTVSPGGKLPYTYHDADYQWAYNFTNMAIANGTAAATAGGNASTTGGRTYRYFTGDVLYPFGFGLSYADLTLSWGAGSPAPPSTVHFSASNTSAAVPLSVRVTCSSGGPAGLGAADEVVQAYFVTTPGSFSDPQPPFLPLRSLFAFQRVRVDGCGAGGFVDVPLSVGPLDLQVTGADNVKMPRPGTFTVVLSRGPGADGHWQGDELTFQVVMGA
jgi:xylan 1,4-beta-xylosidase